MANIAVPRVVRQESWLDRPLLPSWQRILAFTAHWELIAYACLIAAGFLLRVWAVGDRAMHHDESLHAYFAWKLYAAQGYQYDPLMHGPFQFIVVPLFYLLFGVSEFSARLLAVLLGTGLIFLPYLLRRYITRGGAMLTALMLAISPSMVYFSRFIRDDIYLVFFSLLLFVAIVRYLEDSRPVYMYVAAAASALAMASMEAAYITFFIFGSFLVTEAVREYATARGGPVLDALRKTSIDTWLTATAVFVVITVLLYSTFFTNSPGIWDVHNPLCLKDCLSLHPVWNTQRKDILGGITYWFAQHGQQRGGQPWFYYFLVLPLYEQIAVFFGLCGLIYALIRRTLFRTFLVWWAGMALSLYSWAGEKMPWLSIHITLPLIMLAGIFLGAVVTSRKTVVVAVVGSIFVAFLALEVHSTFLLNYVDAANPTEMLIYVQTSQDVPKVVQEISQISRRPGMGGTSMPIGLDANDVGGWPFLWYLRDYTSVQSTPTLSFGNPVCGSKLCPVLLMLDPQFNTYGNQLLKHYVAQKYRWNWWFPEDYKVWFPQHWSDISSALRGSGQFSLSEDLFGTAQDRSHLWDWLSLRRPFGDRGARYLYFLVRRDLVPNARDYPTTIAGLSQSPTNPAPVSPSSGNVGQLSQPRGIATDGRGNVYVADSLDHRIAVFSRTGKLVRTWGSVGVSPGQFNANASPQGVALGPDHLVYVTDTWGQRIEVFTEQGKFVRQWGGGSIGTAPGQYYGPRSIAISRNGHVYVADTGNKRIQVFSPQGQFLTMWGTPGSGPAQFNEPSSVSIGPDGTVYVADFWNQRIQAFSATGSYLRSWSVPDWTPQSYDEPYLVVEPTSGHIFASDPHQRVILQFSADGRLISRIGSAALSQPIGVAVEPGGRIAVSDAQTNQLSFVKWGVTGALLAGTPISQQPTAVIKKP